MSDQASEQRGQLTAEELDEQVPCYAAKGMRWTDPGDNQCRSVKPGDKFVARRRQLRWLEATKKGHPVQKVATRMAEYNEALVTREIQHVQGPTEGAGAPAQ